MELYRRPSSWMQQVTHSNDVIINTLHNIKVQFPPLGRESAAFSLEMPFDHSSTKRNFLISYWGEKIRVDHSAHMEDDNFTSCTVTHISLYFYSRLSWSIDTMEYYCLHFFWVYVRRSYIHLTADKWSYCMLLWHRILQF